MNTTASAATTTIPVFFTSVWSEGEVETSATMDLATGEIVDIETADGDGYEHLIEEYVETADGNHRATVEPDDDGRYFVKDKAELAALHTYFNFTRPLSA